MSVPMTQGDENRFWLQVMGDKARIVQRKLYPVEPKLVARADAFITRFDKLLIKISETPNQGSVNVEAYGTVQDFRKYLLEIIRSQISEKLVIGILPDYMAVFINECEQYL